MPEMTGHHNHDLPPARPPSQAAAPGNELFYRALVENTSMLMCEIDLHGHYTYANPAYRQILGYEPAELIGQEASQYLHPDEVTHAAQEFDALLASGGPAHHTWRFRHRDGKYKWLECRANLYCSLQGETRIIVVSNDISERRNAAELLAARTTFETSPAGIILVDPQGIITFANPSMAELFGCPLSELLGSPYPQLVHPDHRETGTAKMHQLIRGEIDTVSLERHYLRADGSDFWGHLSGRRMIDDDGRLINLVGVITDITRRRQIEQALSEREQIFSAIFEQAGVGVALTESHTGRLLRVNQKYCELAGYPRQEMEGMTLADVTHPDDLQANLDQVNLMLGGQTRGFSLEKRYLHKDSRVIWIRLTVTPLWQPGEAPSQHIAVIEDITERKLAEESLRSLADESTWEAQVNAALAALYQPLTSPGVTIQEIAQVVLDQARRLTESQHGYVSEIDPLTGETVGHTLTEMLTDGCEVQGEERRVVFPRSPDGSYAGLWGHALNTRQGFYTNDPTNHPAAGDLPQAHISLERFLAVPVVLGDELVGQIALAGGRKNYTPRDLQAIQDLAEYYALAIQRLRAEDKLTAALGDKEILLRELHHRTKNNMQVISSLLNLEIYQTSDPNVQKTLTDMDNRVHSMALVHQKHHRSGSLSTIDLKDYLEDLADILMRSYQVSIDRVSLIQHLESVPVLIDTAVPCGLVVNEIISNALKYAFPGERRGEIHLRLSRLPNSRIQLEISDDGIGIPPSQDLRESSSLGAQIITGIAGRQLGAQIDLETTRGVTWRLTFAEDKYQARI